MKSKMMFAIVVINNKNGLDISYFENEMERNKYWTIFKMDGNNHVAKIEFDGDRKMEFSTSTNTKPFRNKPIHHVIQHFSSIEMIEAALAKQKLSSTSK